MAVRELSFEDYFVERIKDLPDSEIDGMVLVCQENIFDKIMAKNKIDLIRELAKDSSLAREYEK